MNATEGALIPVPSELERWLDWNNEKTFENFRGDPDLPLKTLHIRKRMISEALAARNFMDAVFCFPDPARWWMLDHCVSEYGVTPATTAAFEGGPRGKTRILS